MDIRVKDETDIHVAKRLIQTLAVVLAYDGKSYFMRLDDDILGFTPSNLL